MKTRNVLKAYSLVPDRFKEKYFAFYKELYNESENTLDLKTIELISLAVSVSINCKGCFEGHLKKAAQYGATKAEVGEAISVAIGIQAASIVDRTDPKYMDEDLSEMLWDENGKSKVLNPKARPLGVSH